MAGNFETLGFEQKLCPPVFNMYASIHYFKIMFYSLNIHCVKSVNVVEKKQNIGAEGVPL